MVFAPLHVYSGFSFLRSGFSLPKIIARAKASSFPYLGLSDFESMSGFPELYHGLEDSSVKPVFGLDTVIEGHGFSLYAKDEDGYRNLLALGAASSKGEIDLPFLKSHQKGLAVVLQIDASPLPFEPYDEASLRDGLRALCNGLDDFHLGLPYGQNKGQIVANCRDFVAKYPYSTLAFPFIRYEKEEDAIVLSIVEAIAKEEQLQSKTKTGDEHWLSENELSAFYTPEELEASVQLAASCSSFSFLRKRGGLLVFPTPEGETSQTYLRKLAYEGLKAKNPTCDERYTKRLEYELGVIHQMGYDDYFLIVGDYVRFAKTHGVGVGPGRGSGAGSLVSYCLDIVTPDPIRYNLLFERFLNPMRSSMPDIDVDFGDTKRDLVVTYLQQKYGEERVGHIITMQTLGARASLRDVGRVFNYPSHDIDVLAKAIAFPMHDLRYNYKKAPGFREIVDSDPYYLEIVTLASKIEGLPRQSGLHAAGIVLNDTPLASSIPTKNDEFAGSVVGFEMNYLEEQGFLKMDILGLRNITIVEHCLNLVKQTKGLDLDYQKIPYDDKGAIGLIASGKTMGLFQLESPGMNRAIATVKPTSFEDVVAVIALFRPGPMENIPAFARRKQGVEPITYLHPLLKPILQETYGIIVYQEQIMLIATSLAGMTMGQADLFRRAISKKNAAKLEALRNEFLAGCAANRIDSDTSVKVFNLIERFANYGFNKSHALAYGLLACQMAYLKKTYPVEFYCAILDGTAANDPKFPSMVSEIKRSGLRLVVPSVNEPSLLFSPCKEGIRFPLTAIKGLPYALARGIIEEVELHGPFGDIFDFALRTMKHGLSQASLIKLIEAGALDCLDKRRATLSLASSGAIAYAEMLGGDDGDTMLLDLNFPKPEIIPVEENKMTDLLAERDALGLMVSGSPLSRNGKAARFHRLSELEHAMVPMEVSGIVGKCKAIVTKKGAKMAFLTLYDEETELEFTLFAEDYTKGYPYLKEGNAISLTARKDTYRDRQSYLASNIAQLEE